MGKHGEQMKNTNGSVLIEFCMTNGWSDWILSANTKISINTDKWKPEMKDHS